MPTRGARRRVALIQFSEILWWILLGRSFHSPVIIFCWNGDSAYTTAFILTGCFPISPPPPFCFFFFSSSSSRDLSPFALISQSLWNRVDCRGDSQKSPAGHQHQTTCRFIGAPNTTLRFVPRMWRWQLGRARHGPKSWRLGVRLGPKSSPVSTIGLAHRRPCSRTIPNRMKIFILIIWMAT